MEGQWSLWLQVSEGGNGTSRLHSWGDAGLAQSLSQGEGWDKVVPVWLGSTGVAWRHTGCLPSQVLPRVGEHHCPSGLELWLCSSRHPVGGTPGKEGATGQRIFGEWLEAPGTRCQTRAFHSATEEYLGPEGFGSSPRPWPTHGDLGVAWLTSFCQHLRCVSPSFCYLAFQIHLCISPGKRHTATHRCPTSPGRRGEAPGLTIALKSSGCPYVQDLCHSGPVSVPWGGRQTRSPEPVHPFSFHGNRDYTVQCVSALWLGR